MTKKLSRKDLEEIIERDLPGRRLVDAKPVGTRDVAVDSLAVDARSPSLGELRRKFLGGQSGATSKSAASPDVTHDVGGRVSSRRRATPSRSNADEQDESLIVRTAPSNKAGRGADERVVVVSAREGRVIMEQG